MLVKQNDEDDQSQKPGAEDFAQVIRKDDGWTRFSLESMKEALPVPSIGEDRLTAVSPGS